MKKIARHLRQTLSLVLVLSMLFTSVPVQAFAAEAPVPRIPVSAPLEQPEPVDYEAQQQAADESGGASASTPDSTPAESAPPASSNVPESAPTEAPDSASASAPEEIPDSSSSSDSSPAPESADASESASGTGPEEDNSSSKAEPAAEETPEEPPVELRAPILREKYDPYAEKYGAPVEVSEYARVFSAPSANLSRAARGSAARKEYITVISPVPNTYVDENGQEHAIDNTLVVEDKNGVPTYENAANDLALSLPVEFAPGDGLCVTLDGASMRLVPLEGDFTHPSSLENAVRYNEVFPDVDVQYTAQELMVKEDIILNAPSEHSTFRYLLDAPGLDARMIDGVLYLFQPGSDKPVFHLSAPYMTDAAGQMSYAVSVALEEKDGQRIVTVSADAAWLSAPERAYPVILDPSIVNTEKAAASMFTAAPSYYYNSRGTASAGYAYKYWAGYPDDGTWQTNRAFLHFDNMFANLPEDAEIESAELVLYEYVDLSGGTTTFEVYKLNSSCTFDEVDAHTGFGSHWDFITSREREFAGSFVGGVGYHRVDVTEIVNNWQKGIEPNYGLMLMSSPENNVTLGGLFYNAGLTPDVPPSIEIKWYEVGDVDRNYPLDDTTINLRPINATDRSGKIEFYGAFWDGIATPGATLEYKLNVESKNYAGSMELGNKFLYPNSTLFQNLFPDGATKYSRRLSNWQTVVPFVDFDYDTVYTLSATPTKDGVTGKAVTSEPFLIYKVKQFDTLTKIANYYGVDYDQLARDNRVVDRLLVENNTLFIRNPKTAEPYNPSDLSDEDKTLIDTMLMGRGLHCEFGFEPINLNTGNFYLAAQDAAVTDLGGQFSISRTYNSVGASIHSMFGRGWSFEYDEALSQLADGSIAYRRGDGSILPFTPDGNGGFTGPAGYGLSLSRIKTGEVTEDFGTEEDPDVQTFDVCEYEITSRDGTVRRFNSWGLLASITDINGFTTALSYDAAYNLTGVTTPSGKTFAIALDENGMIRSVTLPDGGLVRYAYDDAGNLVSYFDALGNETKYIYDAAHRMTSWVDANGTAMVVNVYDEKGRVVEQTDGNGGVSKLAYEDGKTIATDAAGNITVYHYDGQYRTTRIEYPDGTAESFEYDAGNQRSAFVDKLGNRTAYEYDAAGNLTKQTRFDGASQIYTYNAQNKPASFTDYAGKTTRYEYNEAGDMTAVIYNDGTQNTFTYDANHNPITMTDAMGGTATFEYDGALLVKMTDAAGSVYTFGYDAMGRRTSVTDPLGNTSKTVFDAAGRTVGEQAADGAYTEYIYDAAGRVVATIDPNGNRLDFGYDANDNMTSITDAEGSAWAYTFDALGNKLAETDPLGNTLAFTYDAMSRMLTSTDADGYTTTYAYDALGNQTSITAPDGGVTSVEYDYATGQIAKTIDPLGNVTTYEYNAVGLPTKQTCPDGSSMLLEYDAMGRLAQYTDLLGLVTTFAYDANGNELSVADSAGRTVQYERDANGRTVKTTLPGGGTVSYAYDALGRVSQMTDAMEGVSSLTYNAVGSPLTVTNENGASIGYVYDANGNVTQQTDPKGSVWTSAFDNKNNVTLTKDPTGAQTLYVYDAAGRLAEIHDALGNATRYRLNGRGLPVEIIDALGQKYTMEYDAAGNLIKETLPDGSSTQYAYNRGGRLIRMEDADGLVTEYEYDVLGNVTKETNNAGLSYNYTYNAVGLPLTATDALGQTTRYTYDNAGNLISVQEFDGNVTEYAYDAAGNVTSIRDPEGKVTTYTYDLNGNLLQSEDASLRQWKYTYDKIGQLTSVTDSLGAVTKYFYDENENLTRRENADGSALKFDYDVLNRVTGYTDGNGNLTQNSYDALGNVIGQVNPDGGEIQYLYDALSRVTKQRDPMGYVTEYAYDAVGNLISATLPNGETYAYTYNHSGFRTSETDPLGNVTQWEPDRMNRLVKKTLASGAQYGYAYDVLGRVTGLTGPEGRSLTYAYDDRGNLASETDALGRVTAYAYDAMHRVTGITDANLGVTGMSYDANGNLAELVSPEGNAEKYTYDALDRIASRLDPAGAMTQYVYDVMGNLTQITEPQGRTTTMSYDANGNMTGVTDALGQTTSFQYDSMDRVLKATDARGASVQYTYDLNGRVTQVLDPLNAATQYEYDSMGNVTLVKDAESRATQYAYDALDRLTSVTDGTGVTTSYGYDSVGNLVTRTDGEGKTTAYAYDLAGQLVSTTNAKGETTQNTYNEVGNRVGAQLPSGKSITYDYDALDALVQKSYSTGEADVLYSYSPDGNLVSMRDATGDSTYTYDANGRLVSYTNAFSATVSYAYNENSEISAITYPDGKTVGYEYDALGRMVKVTGRDGGETVYEYDAQGSVTQVARADGSVTTAEYDLAGRVVRLTNRDASGAVVSEFSYTYDATGYIATETVTQGERSAERSYTYTQRGELATATENGQTVAYTYDGAGNRIKEEGPNGTTVFVYDEADRLQSTSGASVTAYTWDADGNMTSVESGEGVYEYIYDTESRLLAVREGGSLLMSVLYDGLGDRSYGLEFKMIDRHLNKFPHLPGYWNNGHWNCIPDAPEGPKNPKQANAAAENTPAEVEEGPGFWQGVLDWFTGLFGGEDEASGEASTYGVGNANGDYTNNGGADNDHGGNGNTNNGNGKPGNNGNGSGNNGNGNNKGDGGAISDWAIKKLKKLGFTDMDIEMLERLGVTDADARQIIETAKVPNTGNGPTHFIPAYDLMYYVNDVNRENTEVLTLGSRYNSDTSFVYGQQRLYADHEGESETYLYDGRGSVVQLLKDGAVTQEYAYDAYGYINADEFGIQAPFYGYNGEEQNPFTGLQYLRARYYAPQNGGFITQDSFSGVLDDALTQNRYTYAGNNPVNNIDPSGHRYVKGIEIGDNLKSSSAKKQPTTSGRPLSPGLTGAVVKKTTTSKKAPAISGSIAANAALSAARAGVPVGASSAVVNAIRQEPYISIQNASGQTVTVPSHFSNIAEAAKNFIRRVCDAEMQRIETQRAVEQAQQKILSDTVHSAGNAISAFYKAWNANANYWHDYYNNATNVGDFLYGGVNYFTYGLIDGINKSYQQRHQEMLDDFTLYNIANWGLSGIPDRVKGAIAPEDPLSLQHWLDSFSVVMIGYGLYQGYQFANAPANTINTAHPVTGTGMLDDFADDTVNKEMSSLPANQGYASFDQLKNAVGTAGDGNDWHHIVEQSQIAKSGFSAEQIHNTSNIVAIDHATHMKITGYYNTKSFDFTSGLSVRDWLSGQSFEVQYEFGVGVLKNFGVIQ